MKKSVKFTNFFEDNYYLNPTYESFSDFAFIVGFVPSYVISQIQLDDILKISESVVYFLISILYSII